MTKPVKLWWLWILPTAVVACTVRGPADSDNDTLGTGGATASGPTSGRGSATGGATSGGGSPASSGGQSSGGSAGAGGVGTGGSGGLGPDGCYTEGIDASVSLADLENGYNGGQWLPTMLDVLGRRYANGWWVLDQMQSDPWLSGSFPSYFDLSTWSGMIESVDTACHEETHGYDFDQSLSLPNQHLYYMGSNLQVAADELAFFARSEILPLVTQGGSVTANYDATYLTGSQGDYDFIFLADELTAYINGLACATAVADHLGGYGYSFRDGAAAHLYYLQSYLRVARTQHPALYNQWKSDAGWQSFVRLSWARGHYWTQVSQPYANLGINDAAIWSRIDQPNNLSEIEQFTGAVPADVACNP